MFYGCVQAKFPGKTQRASVENFFPKHPRIMHKFSKTSNNSTKLYILKNFGKISKNFTKCFKKFTNFYKKNPNGNSNFYIILTNKSSIDFFEKKIILQKLITKRCKVLYVAQKMHKFFQSASKSFLKTSMLHSFGSACNILDAFSKIL